MKTLSRIFPVVVLLLLNLSCEDDLRFRPSDKLVVESRLQFQSNDHLVAFLNDAKEKGYEKFSAEVRGFQKDGFKSLMPVFDMSDENQREEFRTFKINQRRGFYSAVFGDAIADARVEEEEIDLTEDEFIADPFFASLLNRDREIEVGGQIYKFTSQGVLFASNKNYNLLKSAFEEIKGQRGQPKKVSFQSVSLWSPVEQEGLVDGCIDPMARCAPEQPVEPTPTPIPAPVPQPAPTKEEVKNNLKICYWDPDLWDDIFGPAEGCEDYFESDKRIKTKTWNQNYLIFSSVGVKVESQNRLLRIWWADDIDEVELGYTSVYFEYKLPTPSWPNNKYEYQYVYEDYRINQYGQYLGNAAGGPKSIFSEFPIQDVEKRILTIYLFQPLEDILGMSSLDLTAKDVNQGIESLVKQGFSTMKNYLKKEINGNTAVVVYPSADSGTLKFLFTNWTNTNSNDNKISETFDWNTAVIGFSSKGTSTTPIYDSPQSYKKFKSVCYGMGRRGTTWKGSRVVLLETK